MLHQLLVRSPSLISALLRRQMTSTASNSLTEVVSKLNAFAPLTLAESWDNVGLLIEPATPRLVPYYTAKNDQLRIKLNVNLFPKTSGSHFADQRSHRERHAGGSGQEFRFDYFLPSANFLVAEAHYPEVNMMPTLFKGCSSYNP